MKITKADYAIVGKEYLTNKWPDADVILEDAIVDGEEGYIMIVQREMRSAEEF